MPWTLRSVEALAGQPNADAAAIEQAALQLSELLMAAPADFLEPLLASPFGRVYRLFLERCCLSSPRQPATVQQRDQLSQLLRSSGFQGEQGPQLLLALMPFFPPGQMKVDDAPAKLPGWLLEIYQLRYEAAASQPSSPAQPTGQPSFNDRIFLNRMLGLSNLYYIDPEDQEILAELRQVRLQTVTLMLNASREELGRHFAADFGDRFWAMAQSGVQKEALSAEEARCRDEIQQWLSTTPRSLLVEGGIQRFAAALLFNPPGAVQLANPEQNLPAWFVEGFKRFNSMAVAA
jgi:hypothetical protein